MANSRINKFIFQQCHSFLRLRTVAKDLKIVRNGTNYIIEIPKAISATVSAEIPVTCLTNTNIETAIPEALTPLDLNPDDQQVVKTIDFSWGKLVRIYESKSNSNIYFIFPHDVVNAVKLGPIPQGVENNKLEIDWQNLQWLKHVDQ